MLCIRYKEGAHLLNPNLCYVEEEKVRYVGYWTSPVEHCNDRNHPTANPLDQSDPTGRSNQHPIAVTVYVCKLYGSTIERFTIDFNGKMKPEWNSVSRISPYIIYYFYYFRIFILRNVHLKKNRVCGKKIQPTPNQESRVVIIWISLILNITK